MKSPTIQRISSLIVDRGPSDSSRDDARNEPLVGMHELGDGLCERNDGIGIDIGHKPQGGVSIDGRMFEIDSGTTIGGHNDLSRTHPRKKK